jgi:hypothetical protein
LCLSCYFIEYCKIQEQELNNLKNLELIKNINEENENQTLQTPSIN